MRNAVNKLPIKDVAEVPLAAIGQRYAARVDPARAAVAALEQRMQESRQRAAIAAARSRGQAPTQSLAARAAALLAGGKITAAAPADEAAAAAEEQRVLLAALFDARAALAQIVDEVSTEVCKEFAPLNTELHVTADSAAEALFDSLNGLRVLRARLIAGGYSISSLPCHEFAAAAVLGNPRQATTGLNPAWAFREWLRSKGMLS